MRRLILLPLAVALGAACDSFDGPVPPASPSVSPSASAVAAGVGPRRDSEQARLLSRGVADAALAVTKTCVVLSSYYASTYDDCTFGADELGKLSSAADALAAHAKAHPEEVSHATKTFMVAASMFTEWTGRVIALNRRRGTLALFQDFADAYNATEPAAPIPVDPVTEMYKAPVRGFNPATLDTSKRVPWRPCLEGVCLWYGE